MLVFRRASRPEEAIVFRYIGHTLRPSSDEAEAERVETTGRSVDNSAEKV